MGSINGVEEKELGFFGKWKRGIEAITPLQQTTVSLIGTVWVLVGIFVGLYATFTTEVWWLFIILLGSLLLSSMSFLGMLQRYFALKKVDELMKGGDSVMLNNKGQVHPVAIVMGIIGAVLGWIMTGMMDSGIIVRIIGTVLAGAGGFLISNVIGNA